MQMRMNQRPSGTHIEPIRNDPAPSNVPPLHINRKTRALRHRAFPIRLGCTASRKRLGCCATANFSHVSSILRAANPYARVAPASPPSLLSSNCASLSSQAGAGFSRSPEARSITLFNFLTFVFLFTQATLSTPSFMIRLSRLGSTPRCFRPTPRRFRWTKHSFHLACTASRSSQLLFLLVSEV